MKEEGRKEKKGGGFSHLLQLENPHLMFKKEEWKYFWRQTGRVECVSIQTFFTTLGYQNDSASNFLLACESCQRLRTNEVEN